MLTKRDLQLDFVSIRIGSLLGFYPVEVDPANNVVSMQTSKSSIGRRALHGLQICGWVLHTFVTVYRLVEMIMHRDSSTFAHLPCPLACVGFSFIMLCDYVVIFWVHPEFYTKFITVCYDFFPGVRPKQRKWNQRTLHELFAVFLVPLLLCVPVLHVLIFLVIPSGPNFIYYNLPERMRNSVTFAGCAVTEGYLVTMWLSMALFLNTTQLLTFHLVLAEMDVGMKAIGDCMGSLALRTHLKGTLEAEQKRCRKVQLMLRIFNEANSRIQSIQTAWYFYDITLLWYFGIRLFMPNVVLGASFVGISAIATIFFVLSYERASGIPMKMSKYRSRVKELASRCDDERLRGVVKRSLDSVQHIGIKVGDFTRMHRLSALVFINFVAAGIFNLLIAY